MKRIIITLLIFVSLFFALTTCTSSRSISESTNNAIADPVIDTENLEKTAEDNVVKLFEQIIVQVKAEGIGTKIKYKELENIYKLYPTNVVISNLYFYCVANDYLTWEELMGDASYLEKAKDTVAKIDPNYTGPYSIDIIAFAKDLLGDSYVDTYNSSSALQDNYNKLLIKDKADIIAYIKSRYIYYDKKEGSSSGDKYSDIIWQETAEKYKISTLNVDSIWMDIDVIDFYNSSDFSSSSLSDVIVYDATLKYGGTDVFVAISEDSMDRFFTAISKNSEGSLQDLEKMVKLVTHLKVQSVTFLKQNQLNAR